MGTTIQDIGIIYENQNVYILHIDNLSQEYNKEINGTLSLIERTLKHRNTSRETTERCITWRENPDVSNTNQTTIRPITINLEDLKSFKRSKMTVGNYHSFMIFFMRDGSSHPMMAFRDGGTKNLMDKLENYLAITKSDKERYLYVTELRKEDAVLKSFDSLELFSNTKQQRASRYSRPNVTNHATKVLTGLANIGAMTSHILRHTMITDESSQIREMLKQDAYSIDENRLSAREDNDTGFEIISRQIRIDLPHLSPVQRRPPLTEHEWRRHLSPDGTVTCVDQLKEKIFKGGIEMSLRPVIWKYLLNYYKWNNSLEQNHEITRKKSDLYHKIKIQWLSVIPEQEERFTLYRERKSLIEKDMLRTDRALEFYSDENGKLQTLYHILLSYSIYNFDLGYVQGMNDLLAPILYLLEDEVDAFWCFANLMDTLEPNFNQEQLGIKIQFRQLYTLLQIFDPEFADYIDRSNCREMLFCFRWLLVLFKRELSYENTMLLWEVLWTNYRCVNFHLIFAISVLLHEKNNIMVNGYGFSEILKHVNNLRLNNDIHTHLSFAESLYMQLDQVWCQIPEDIREILDLRISSQTTANHSTIMSAKTTDAFSDQSSCGKSKFNTIDLEANCLNDGDSFDR